MEKYQNINIIYETNHLLVVEKPINMPVCSDESKDKDLLTILKQYLKEKYHKQGNVYLGLVHRLDRQVGGIMVFAKTSKSASRLSKQIADKEFKKTYYAVIKGNLKEKDTLIDYLAKDNKKNISFVTTKDKGKYSKLDYTITDKVDNLNLVKINLETGRPHQIRVQFSSRGFPLYGDIKYGNKNELGNIALFAKELTIHDPITDELLNFNIELPNNYPFTLFKK